jgi:hypothetical protein
LRWRSPFAFASALNSSSVDPCAPNQAEPEPSLGHQLELVLTLSTSL